MRISSRAIIVSKEKTYLICRRTDHGELWELIGGLHEESEKAEETIIREIKEEIGITCSVTFLREFYNPISDTNIFLYYAKCSSSPPIKLSSEHSEYRWIKPKDLDNFEFIYYDRSLIEWFLNTKTKESHKGSCTLHK